jgi:DNA-binding NarL/FixJ family response regulator
MLSELRKKPWGKSIKVVVLTNKGEQEIPPEIRDLGVSAVILKADKTPMQVAEFVKSVLIS